MKCPRCLNTDKRYFYRGSKGWYCRKCISFGRVLLEENEQTDLCSIKDGSEEYVLKYPLTVYQKKAAAECLFHIHETDVLIQAVCGAGKTEIVIPSISDFLQRKMKVCFAIARRQVVLEVGERLSGYFRYAKVVSVCGGHTDETDGDLIVCTTHQLYRYYQSFDLLILDEPDAFPFRGNDVLHGVAQTACRGHCIYLSATPDEILMKRYREKKLYLVRLDQRPHGHPLPVPEIIVGFRFEMFVRLAIWLKRHHEKPCIVFVPTIAMAKCFGRILNLLFDCEVCTSRSENRDAVIEAFRRKKNGVLLATTVLERGVTIPHADVCVYMADHNVFDEAGLVQMAGRAGRDFADPKGDVLFLCTRRSEKVEKCRKSIIEANMTLHV